MERSAGILLPVFSLPGPYGIGSLGREARAFAEFLHNAGQRWWQVLPVGQENQAVGFAALKETSPCAGEIYVMGVLPE